jgi:hypothetical protein
VTPQQFTGFLAEIAAAEGEAEIAAIVQRANQVLGTLLPREREGMVEILQDAIRERRERDET